MSTGTEPGHKLKAEHNLVGKVEEDLAEGERRCFRRHSRKDQGGVSQKAQAKTVIAKGLRLRRLSTRSGYYGAEGGDSSLESDEPVKSGC